MLTWLRQRWRGPGRFALPAGPRRLPACTLRLLADEDIPACEALYRLNEPDRFPPGYFGCFSDWLRQRRALILVAEVGGQVRGLGGVNMDMVGPLAYAALTFGMVHPAAHRQGFGTALLLARLSLLPLPARHWTVLLTTTGGSETFYRRFGFHPTPTTRDNQDLAMEHHQVHLWPAGRAACIAALHRSAISLSLPDTPIPCLAALESPVKPG